MPTFEVQVAGGGLCLRLADVETVTFVRVLRVVETDRHAAELKALSDVRAYWDASRWARQNRGSGPKLRVVKVTELSWWHRFLLWKGDMYLLSRPEVAVMPSNNRWRGP
jgi:hypothetical protein